MEKEFNHIINFETRVEIQPDMALIETFQDGSQLVHKRGFMIIIDSCKARVSTLRLKAKVSFFSMS